MTTLYRSFLLKNYYGNTNFYKNVKEIIADPNYNTKTLKGAVDVMWELGTYNFRY
jgi:hypothetical protein